MFNVGLVLLKPISRSYKPTGTLLNNVKCFYSDSGGSEVSVPFRFCVLIVFDEYILFKPHAVSSSVNMHHLRISLNVCIVVILLNSWRYCRMCVKQLLYVVSHTHPHSLTNLTTPLICEDL